MWISPFLGTALLLQPSPLPSPSLILPPPSLLINRWLVTFQVSLFFVVFHYQSACLSVCPIHCLFFIFFWTLQQLWSDLNGPLTFDPHHKRSHPPRTPASTTNLSMLLGWQLLFRLPCGHFNQAAWWRAVQSLSLSCFHLKTFNHPNIWPTLPRNHSSSCLLTTAVQPLAPCICFVSQSTLRNRLSFSFSFNLFVFSEFRWTRANGQHCGGEHPYNILVGKHMYSVVMVNVYGVL